MKGELKHFVLANWDIMYKNIATYPLRINLGPQEIIYKQTFLK